MDRLIVTVNQGKLQGIFEENVLGSRYLSFKGIPFAAPPVGALRFKVTYLSSPNNLIYFYLLCLRLKIFHNYFVRILRK